MKDYSNFWLGCVSRTLFKQAFYYTALDPKLFDHLTFYQKESKDNIAPPDPPGHGGASSNNGTWFSQTAKKVFS